MKLSNLKNQDGVKSQIWNRNIKLIESHVINNFKSIFYSETKFNVYYQYSYELDSQVDSKVWLHVWDKIKDQINETK